MYHLNKFKCITSPTVDSTISLDYWFDQIKHSAYIDLINIARGYKKLLVATNDLPLKAKYKKKYNAEKEDLPTIAYNVIFDSYRNTENIISSTGLLYIDIDDTSFCTEFLDKSKIYAYYRSIGGLGYSLLVQVEGLTIANYSSTFDSIVNHLGISKYVDRDAKGIIQQSVLSYDPDIYINKSSYIFSSNNEFISCTQPPTNNQKRKEHITVDGYKVENFVRFNNLYDFEFEDDYISNWDEGFAYVKCYLPTVKLFDKRKRILLSYLNNLIWLNQNIPYYHALNIMSSANQQICVDPIPTKVLEGMLKSIIKQKNDNKLKPHITIRRILFAPHCGLDVCEKRLICGRVMSENWKSIGCNRLQDIIVEWNFKEYGKITVASIAKNSTMNKKTVAKYYKYFKDSIVNQANETYRLALKQGNNINLLEMLMEFEAA